MRPTRREQHRAALRDCLQDAARRGLTRAEAAAELGASVDQVKRAARVLGVDWPRSKRSFQRRRRCAVCQREFVGHQNRKTCGVPKCRGSIRSKPSLHEAALSAGEVVAMLDRDAARESFGSLLPPWERHPQPWTDVVVRHESTPIG